MVRSAALRFVPAMILLGTSLTHQFRNLAVGISLVSLMLHSPKARAVDSVSPFLSVALAIRCARNQRNHVIVLLGKGDDMTRQTVRCAALLVRSRLILMALAFVLTDGGTRRIFRHVNSGGSFGANPLRQTIGLGKSETISRLEVFWPTTGATQTFNQPPIDCLIRIHEDVQSLETVQVPTFQRGPE